MTPRDVAREAFPGLEFNHTAPDPLHAGREYAYHAVADDDTGAFGDVAGGLKLGQPHLWVCLEMDVDERGIVDAAGRLVESLRRLADVMEGVR